MLLTLRAFVRAVRAGLQDPEYRTLVTLVALVLLAGTVFYRAAERWSWLDSLYFSVTTLTTVGLGDLSPSTGLSKAFTIVYILLGIGILVGFLERTARYVQRRETPRGNPDQDPRRRSSLPADSALHREGREDHERPS